MLDESDPVDDPRFESGPEVNQIMEHGASFLTKDQQLKLQEQRLQLSSLVAAQTQQLQLQEQQLKLKEHQLQLQEHQLKLCSELDTALGSTQLCDQLFGQPAPA